MRQDDREKLMNETPERGKRSKRTYKAPELTDYGDLRDVTLGGSPGSGDTGNASTHFPPVG